MRKLPWIMLPLVSLLLGGCAITHTYGPYKGQVVEKGSGEPIEGAVVFMRFYTDGLFGISQFEDAVEVLTDGQGEFHIPAELVFSRWPAPFSNWDPGYAIVFKPGYGAFPGHKETLVDDERNLIPENKHVTIKLPKLETREERGRNVGSALSFSMRIPYDKYRLLFDAVNQERVFLRGESPRDCRKPQFSSGWSLENQQGIQSGGMGAGSPFSPGSKD